MATSASIYSEAARVLAEIKSGVSMARVVDLQREYRKLSRAYEQATRAEWAQAPLGPVQS